MVWFPLPVCFTQLPAPNALHQKAGVTADRMDRFRLTAAAGFGWRGGSEFVVMARGLSHWLYHNIMQYTFNINII